MEPIIICTDPPEIRGNIKIANPNLLKDPDVVEEEDQFLPFLRLNYCKIVMDPMMVIY